MSERQEYRVVTVNPDGEERKTACYDMKLSAEEMLRRAERAGHAARMEVRTLQVGEWSTVEQVRPGKSARDVACPTCGAEPGEDCWVHHGGPRGSRHASAVFHVARRRSVRTSEWEVVE